MEIETFEVAGIEHAIHAMRNPLSSWEKSDSEFDHNGQDNWAAFELGPADAGLSLRLQKAGSEHCKHLRMIMVWADIDAPLYWWKQADCYRNGVEKVSTSTMHTMMRHMLTLENFEPTSDGSYSENMFAVIDYINKQIAEYAAETDPETRRYIWDRVIQILPESFIQRRTVMFSYAALRNIVRQRKGHKLGEWKVFINWVHTLPYADQLIFDDESKEVLPNV